MPSTSSSNTLFIVKSGGSFEFSVVHLCLRIHLILRGCVKCIASSQEPWRLAVTLGRDWILFLDVSEADSVMRVAVGGGVEVGEALESQMMKKG